MKIDRVKLFALLRARLFGGGLSQPVVDAVDAILDHWDANYQGKPLSWLGYALATAYFEPDQHMQPTKECLTGTCHDYAQPDPDTGECYYGRGFVQLTWKVNYEKQAAKLGIDCVANPDLVMVPAHAAAILLDGMRDGDFTGKKFSDYFTDHNSNPIDARQIVNGHDQDKLIASYYQTIMPSLAWLPEAPPAVPTAPDPAGMAGALHAVRNLPLGSSADAIAAAVVSAYLASTPPHTGNA